MRSDFTPRSKLERERAQSLSRREGLRMVAYGVLFLFAIYYVFFTRHPAPLGSEEEAGPTVALPGPKRRGPDAAEVLGTLQRVTEEQRGEVAPQASTAVTTLDPRVFEGIDDSQLDVVEEPAFFQVLALVHGMSDAELARAHETHGAFTWEQLHRVDGSGLRAARGKFITINGRFVIRPWQRVLARYPNEAGLAWVWQSVFREQNRGFFVTITDKNFDPEVGPAGTPIELTGAFVRIYRYRAEAEDENPDPVKELPHIVVKSLKKIPQGSIDIRERTPREVVIAFGVILVLASLSLAVYAWVSRRSMAAVEDWRRGALRRRLGKELAGRQEGVGGGAPGAGAPAAGAPPGTVGPAEATVSPATVSPTTVSPSVAAPATAAGPAEGAPAAVVPAAAPGAAAPPSPAPSAAAAAMACPACGATIAAGSETTVCGACFRRHHRGCWSARCGACGGTEGLVPLSGPGVTPPG